MRTTMSSIISFIGAGNMAYSLLKGLRKANYPTAQLWASHPAADRLTFLQQELSIKTTIDNTIAAKQANIIVLCVKPQQMLAVLQEIAPFIQLKKTLIISIAAGISLVTLQKELGEAIPIIRAMPNLPVMVGSGAIGLFANASADEAQCAAAEDIFRQTGLTCWVQAEHLLDVVAALSGSGPAYCFFMMEAFINQAKTLGLPAEDARLLCAQTFLGAAQLVLNTADDLSVWRERVTSKKGMTEQALRVLTEQQVAPKLQQALQAAYDQARIMQDTPDSQ